MYVCMGSKVSEGVHESNLSESKEFGIFCHEQATQECTLCAPTLQEINGRRNDSQTAMITQDDQGNMSTSFPFQIQSSNLFRLLSLSLPPSLPVKFTSMVVFSSGVSCVNLIIPLIPLWLKVAVTLRVAEVLRGRREMTTEITESRNPLV